MGVAQVAGPIPLGAGCDPSLNYTAMSAGVAQLVAHPTCNRAVPSSSLGVGSHLRPLFTWGFFARPFPGAFRFGRADDATTVCVACRSVVCGLHATWTDDWLGVHPLRPQGGVAPLGQPLPSPRVARLNRQRVTVPR